MHIGNTYIFYFIIVQPTPEPDIRIICLNMWKLMSVCPRCGLRGDAYVHILHDDDDNDDDDDRTNPFEFLYNILTQTARVCRRCKILPKSLTHYK